MNYTAGPWRVNGDGYERMRDDGITPARSLNVWAQGSGEISHVAEVCIPMYGKWDHAEARANARLIAAAPDLLEACKSGHEALKDILNASDNGHPYNDAELKREFNEICNQMHAAIAKAE